MTKSPCFQFYPDDFVGGRPGMMTPDEVGIYTLLLCADWNQNGFVFDPKPLSRWCRTSTRRFLKAWTVVRENFVERDGRMYNPRLEIERAKQQAWKDKSSKGGIKGGGSNRATTVATKEQPKSNIPLPLPLPVVPTATTSARTAAQRAEQEDAATNSEGRQTWLTPYADAWEAQYGGKLSAGPAVKALAPLEKQHGKDETLRRWVIYVASIAGQFASPARFAQTWGEWGTSRPNGRERDPPRKEKARDPVTQKYSDAMKASTTLDE